MSVKITFDFDGIVSGEFTSTNNGMNKLTCKDDEGREDSIEVSNQELTAILFASADERFESLEEVFEVAQKAQRKLTIQLVP